MTTGTGSGKSLCFFIPIVDAVLRAKAHDSMPRTRAIVIYPMNALATRSTWLFSWPIDPCRSADRLASSAQAC
ncbi:DEAD/DEAH box helicase [Pandoraea pulmonicola]|uniref:DEAD/DEAH box helicase n=1 Tax=Pandoraea pulmonicola TaxID=93221 RepID=UPI001F03249C|nr:DEAD/DEAH box helicase [Pandoraea pulmonicola]